MKVLILVLLMAAGMGCKRQQAKILPADTLVKVMWDVIQADEYATGYLARDSTKNIKLERMKMYQQVFALHHVSQKEYFSSFKYYAGKPDLFKAIIDSLSERGVREQRNAHIPVKAVKK